MDVSSAAFVSEQAAINKCQRDSTEKGTSLTAEAAEGAEFI
jgi:hypothetical protein